MEFRVGLGCKSLMLTCSRAKVSIVFLGFHSFGLGSAERVHRV